MSLSLSPSRLASLSPAARAWLPGALALLLFCAQAKGRAIIGFDSRFVLFAQAHGAHGHRPASADEFLPTLQRAYAEGGVHLIDLAIDYSDNHRILDEEIRRLSAAV